MTAPPTNADLENLIRLRAAGTPGEWIPRSEEHPSMLALWRDLCMLAERGCLTWHWVGVGRTLLFTSMTGNGPTSAANAAFIAAAGNMAEPIATELLGLRALLRDAAKTLRLYGDPAAREMVARIDAAPEPYPFCATDSEETLAIARGGR
jgi:hypothetical protein